MSGHAHENGCGCEECRERDGESSIEDAGGTIIGVSGTISGFNADVAARLEKAIIRTGEFVTEEAGVLLGHIKAAVYLEDGRGLTLSMTNLESGVNRIGGLDPCEEAEFAFMAAVLDVDKHELEHAVLHFLDDTGICMEITSGQQHHHHDHDHEHHHDHGHHHDGCGCGDHDHEHHHDHGHHHDGCGCGCRDHNKRRERALKEARDGPDGGIRRPFFGRFRRRKE